MLTPYFWSCTFNISLHSSDNETSWVFMSRTDVFFSMICCAKIEFRYVIIRPLKYCSICSELKERILPIRVSKNCLGLLMRIPYCPWARTGTIILYFGSSIWIGWGVPHAKSSFDTWFTNQTSAWKGVLFPKGRLIILSRIGILLVLIVYVPAVNSSQISPPFTKKAVWLGWTISCEPSLSESDSNLWTNSSVLISHEMTSAMFMS